MSCCNDKLHMINWAEDDFTDILLRVSVACSGLINTEEGEKHGHMQPSQLFRAGG